MLKVVALIVTGDPGGLRNGQLRRRRYVMPRRLQCETASGDHIISTSTNLTYKFPSFCIFVGVL
jgi:hypothetical protein